jgi:hypothetical protein
MADGTGDGITITGEKTNKHQRVSTRHGYP